VYKTSAHEAQKKHHHYPFYTAKVLKVYYTNIKCNSIQLKAKVLKTAKIVPMQSE